jgi:hypothetical protein
MDQAEIENQHGKQEADAIDHLPNHVTEKLHDDVLPCRA